jgi:hypothetical protein
MAGKHFGYAPRFTQGGAFAVNNGISTVIKDGYYA